MKTIRLLFSTCSMLILLIFLQFSCSGNNPVTGELKKWHKITLTFNGPETSEMTDPNPFLDYRLDVTFRHGEKKYVVPGYFAADGNAANTSAEAGNQWRVHFAPDAEGEWNYAVSFKQGKDVAVADDASAFESAGFMDGLTGTLVVGRTDKTGRDLRGKGRLKYVGKRYLKFAETGEYFLKCGTDAPENFLAYQDFDGPFKSDSIKDELVKEWAAHVQDWKEGDPTWQDGKGKGMIGAINYLASEGLNVFSFLTMNIAGDDRNVFPYMTYDNYERMDVSKLDQWEIVFEHADKIGMYLHFKTQEDENETLLDNGDTGKHRKLYYRTLIAHFGHHMALNWNMGEENGIWGDHIREYQATPQRLAMAQYFYDNDPYHHHIVIHNGQSFDDLLGPESRYTGASLQTDQEDFSRVHNEALKWIIKSREAGKPWVVAVDEPGDHRHSLVPDKDDPTHDNARKNALWGALLSGAAGLEWYFGYEHDHSDLSCEDWRSRDKFWDQCRYALQFFNENDIPFWQMTNDDTLVSTQGDYCFYKTDAVYVVYLKKGGVSQLNLTDATGTFNVKWYNPRNGEFADEIKQVKGGKQVTLGPPPTDVLSDWVVLLEK